MAEFAHFCHCAVEWVVVWTGVVVSVECRRRGGESEQNKIRLWMENKIRYCSDKLTNLSAADGQTRSFVSIALLNG